MGLLDNFMQNARQPGGLLSDEGMYQMAGLLSQLPSFSGRPNAATAFGSPFLQQAASLRGERQQQERAQQVQGLLGRAPQEAAGPTRGGQPLMTQGTGLLGGEISAPEFYGGLLAVPGYEQIGAQGLAGLQSAGEYGKNLYTAVDPATGEMVYVQPNEAGGVRVIRDVRPNELTPQQQIEMYGAKARQQALAEQSTPLGQAQLAASRAQADAAQTKAQEAQAQANKAQLTKQRALATIDRLLDPARRDAMHSALGPIDQYLPALTQGTADWRDDLQKLSDLLTAENLDMMSGVLSETDIGLLRNIAASLPKSSSPERMERELREVQRILGGELAGEGPGTLGAPTRTVNGQTYIKINGEWYQP